MQETLQESRSNGNTYCNDIDELTANQNFENFAINEKKAKQSPWKPKIRPLTPSGKKKMRNQTSDTKKNNCNVDYDSLGINTDTTQDNHNTMIGRVATHSKSNNRDDVTSNPDMLESIRKAMPNACDILYQYLTNYSGPNRCSSEALVSTCPFTITMIITESNFDLVCSEVLLDYKVVGQIHRQSMLTMYWEEFFMDDVRAFITSVMPCGHFIL